MALKSAVKNWLDDLLGRKEYKRFREGELRRERIAGQLWAILTSLCALFYIGWCCTRANWVTWYAFVPFILAELAFLLLLLLWFSMLWNKRHHPGSGPDTQRNFSVDVFIPVCGEPFEIIEPTVVAAAQLDYAQKKMYLLDDGSDDRVKELAEKYAAGYFRRPSNGGRKAGNLNHALEQTDGDLILVLDADQIAQPGLIKAIVGYLDYAHIGFVQTAQSFTVPEDDPWGNSDPVFYKAMQSGKNYSNSAISCGSGVLYRRTALAAVGGFSTWNLVEDVHTSMHLQEQGWHGVYHDTAYTQGTAPTDVISHEKQRWQWAVDSLRFFFWDNPLKHKRLSWPQRLQYLHFGYFYLAFGLFLPIFFILPIWALLTHQFMLSAYVWMYALVRLPYYLAARVTNRLITEKTHSFKAYQAQAALFATYTSAVFTALFSRKRLPEYSVTRKIATGSNLLPRLMRCLPHIILVGFSLIAIVYGLLTIKQDFWFLLVNSFWCCWTIALLWKYIVLSLFPKLFIK